MDDIEFTALEIGSQTATSRLETDNCEAEPRPPSQRGWDESYRDKMAQVQQEWRRTSDMLDQLCVQIQNRPGSRLVLEQDHSGFNGWIARVNVTLSRQPQVSGRGDTAIEAIENLLKGLR